MSEKEVAVSIRMTVDEVQLMEEFMAEKGIDSRSQFIRDAVSGFISLQKRVTGGAIGDGYFIRFNEVQMGALRLMVEDGTIFSEEEFVRKCVLDRIVSPESEADSASRSFKAAQMASKMK
ncbi:MAG: ribbon-helix-helix domain-containing protein [Methanomassiliicoccaceae archaeon]|nr:ribbon-helix-helix domain-containing protein [Methanomassiliicoccaceae archaeon]